MTCSFLWRLEERFSLLNGLRKAGFYVRMHAYEYLLGYNGRIIGVLFLEPSRCLIEIYVARDAGREVLRKLLDFLVARYPGIGVTVHGVSV